MENSLPSVPGGILTDTLLLPSYPQVMHPGSPNKNITTTQNKVRIFTQDSDGYCIHDQRSWTQAFQLWMPSFSWAKEILDFKKQNPTRNLNLNHILGKKIKGATISSPWKLYFLFSSIILRYQNGWVLLLIGIILSRSSCSFNCLFTSCCTVLYGCPPFLITQETPRNGSWRGHIFFCCDSFSHQHLPLQLFPFTFWESKGGGSYMVNAQKLWTMSTSLLTSFAL